MMTFTCNQSEKAKNTFKVCVVNMTTRLRGQSIYLLCLLTFTLSGFSQLKEDSKDKEVFTLLSPEQTKVYFNNTLTQTAENNIFVYKGFYKGGGVAVGDLNNDGLLDLYFTGNQVGDKLYLNKGDLQFEDITQEAGILDKKGWSTHVSIVDINNDGFKDIYVCKSLYDSNPELRENELYINNGDLTFTEAAAAYNLNDSNRTTEANFFDYDRDGDFDVFLINQPKNSSFLAPATNEPKIEPRQNYRLLENTADGFRQSATNGGLSNFGYGLSSSIADYNNDGWQDIYVANDYIGPDFFYINNKDGTFTNKIYDNVQHTSYFSMGSDVGDINNDGWLDFVVLDMVAEDNYRLKSNMSSMNPAEFWENVSRGGHYQYMFNTLQLNNGVTQNGELKFSEIAQMAGVSSTDWSWSPLLADFDNDGRLDLFVTNGIRHEIGNTDALKQLDQYVGEIDKKYNTKNDKSFDAWQYLNLEKLLAFFPSDKIKNYMFHNTNGLKFNKVTDQWGLSQETFSTGAAYGDLDNDGDLDLIVNNIDEVAYIYKNNTNENSNNNYLRIKFLKAKKEQSFFGTKVSLYHKNGLQISELTNARGINSSSEDLVHFGLGTNLKVDSLHISWANGTTTLLNNIKGNRTIVVDYDKVKKQATKVPNEKIPNFQEVTNAAAIDFIHKENRFDDYGREVLLPHRMSTLGSGVAIGDVDANGLDDFYIGAPNEGLGKIFKQQEDGTFQGSYLSLSPDLEREDMGAVFFDADNDGDQDLYVVSGGNEFSLEADNYQDRMYLNNGEGKFVLANTALPVIKASGSRVKVADYDQDGDLDLFVGGRQVPGHYPEPAQSYLLTNQLVETGELKFEKTEEQLLGKLGMVTDAVWTDFDGDQDLDLVVTGMWMPITVLENRNGAFVNSTQKLGLQDTTGWWFSIAKEDMDGDGDDDYVLGNLGVNYKYKASASEPFGVHYGDFDNNGHNDIVLSYYNYGTQYPLRGRSCSSQQIPSIKEKFGTYNEFASSSLTEVYTEASLEKALQYEVKTFESVSIENKGNGDFTIRALPDLAQISNINSAVIYDVDKDGIKDIIIAGNLYGSEIETTRNDASLGLLLKGKKGFNFEAVPMGDSGLNLPEDVKELKLINYGDQKALVVAVNNGRLKLIKIN
ncbi:VCBS repeat-containing protein [Cellulophaga sp. F20128]|uniref:VCBS repeat-containing protein n=1 Tax=Cellulophaga sp. F20128 TaxID=2926413 RepID=UPI001FF65A14|nr:VCBS repeat-containing protein [Cellulophaga sp. F20128]MCK0156306.1 VCBS repeat-containing protein [Cellulophaga sp. F20128]